jgi:hypothetical protein
VAQNKTSTFYLATEIYNNIKGADTVLSDLPPLYAANEKTNYTDQLFLNNQT